MESREAVFLDEEAAVDDLATGDFCNKSKRDNDLFKIGKDEQKDPKRVKNGPKVGKPRAKEKFSFWRFGR